MKISALLILLRTRHQLANKNELQMQAYYDYAERSSLVAKYKVHTVDSDAPQYQFAWGDRQAIIWGLGYQGIQDDIQLNPAVRLTFGSKFSHNSFSGFEYQLSARLLWEMSPQHNKEYVSNVGGAFNTEVSGSGYVKAVARF